MTQAQLDFFNEPVDRVKYSINVNIPIIPCDHSTIKGHKESLGLCHAYFEDDGQWEPIKITIDEYFIEECYMAETENFPYILQLLETDLVGVICHEIAHTQIWRHGKKHRELTKRLIALVEAGEPHGMDKISA